jgi:hypothetical protein
VGNLIADLPSFITARNRRRLAIECISKFVRFHASNPLDGIIAHLMRVHKRNVRELEIVKVSASGYVSEFESAVESKINEMNGSSPHL